MNNSVKIEKEEIYKIFGEINKEIHEYWHHYCKKPAMIILSKSLSMGMQLLMNNYQTKIATGYGDMIYTLFGINCVESPVLEFLEYRIY